MQGRLMGKRLVARLLPRRGRRARRRGLQLPARRRRRHDAGRGLRDGLVGARLRRLRDAPGPRHAAAGPLAGGDRDVPRRRRLARRLRRGRLAAPDPAPPARATRASAAGGRSRAPSSSSSSSATATSRRTRRATAGSSRPTSTTSTTRCWATARVEPLIRRIRNSMEGAGMAVEDSKGECNLGQHEINFHYADALRTADEHVIYKNGAKEIAAEMGMAITFMAKYNEREGNSCHIHFSLTDADGPLFAREPRHLRRVPRRSARGAARADAAARAEHQLLQALRRRARSRRPRSPGATTTAPARCASSATDRRCASRTARAAPTSTPTSRSSALIAAGLHGVDHGLELGPVFEGDAYKRAGAAAPADVAGAGARPVRRLGDRARGLRRGGRRALRQRRRRRARGVREGGHRLGAVSRLRAPVTVAPR